MNETALVAPILYTIPEAAATLRLDVSYCYKLAQAGTLPGVVRFGRAVRIHRETLEQWARQQAGNVPTEATNEPISMQGRR